MSINMGLKNTNTNLYTSINIEQIQEEHIQPAYDIWYKEYQKQKSMIKDLPEKWLTDSSLFKMFLKKHVKTGTGIIEKTGNRVVGYMVYDVFPFHGAKIVYIQIMGHSSVETNRVRIYQHMYKHLSELWVKDNILDHIFTFFESDTQLKNELYQRGFGLYAVDAYRSTEPIHSDGNVPILQASLNDINELMRLGEEFRIYMQEAPLFFVKDKVNRENIEDFIDNKDSAVFVAKVCGEIVGFMSVRKSNKNDIITLTNLDTGKIDELGAYIQPSSRGQGIGTGLLMSVIEWCRKLRIDHIHVDYESANLYASGFWPKYFTPAMYSVRRRVNPDINK